MPDSQNVAEKIKAGILKKTSIYLPARLMREVKAEAAARGISLQAFAAEVFAAAVKIPPRREQP